MCIFVRGFGCCIFVLLVCVCVSVVSVLHASGLFVLFVLLGLIGPTGVTVLKIVMVEFNRELENAKMEKKVIAPDQQLTSSSVI